MFLHLIGDSEGNAPALVYDLTANDINQANRSYRSLDFGSCSGSTTLPLHSQFPTLETPEQSTPSGKSTSQPPHGSPRIRPRPLRSRSRIHARSPDLPITAPLGPSRPPPRSSKSTSSITSSSAPPPQAMTNPSSGRTLLKTQT